MSGPKYSRAYIRDLERLKRIQLELEKQIEEQKKEQLLEDIRKLEKEKESLLNDAIIRKSKEIIKEADKIIPDSKTLKKSKEIISYLEKCQTNKCDTSGDSKALLKEYKAYKKETEKVKNSVLILKDIKKQLSAEGTDALQNTKFDEFMNTEWIDTHEKIDTIPTDIRELYYEVVELLSELPGFEDNKKIIDDTIMKVGDLNYKKKQLEIRKQGILVEKNKSQDNIEFLSKISELKSIYSLLGNEAKELPQTLDEVEKAISEAKSEMQQKEEARIIAESIHKVLSEKGYSLIEDSIVSNKGGNTSKSYFEFGEDSILNVAVSDKGQMLFEVVGDGNPSVMDNARKAKLVSEMKRFCPNYKEIKDILLRDYGISLEDEHLCEPDEKYAKAVNLDHNTGNRRAGKERKKMYLNE